MLETYELNSLGKERQLLIKNTMAKAASIVSELLPDTFAKENFLQYMETASFWAVKGSAQVPRNHTKINKMTKAQIRAIDIDNVEIPGGSEKEEAKAVKKKASKK